MSAQASAKTRPADMLGLPGKGEILSGQRGQGARLDLLHRAEAREPAPARRSGLARGGPARVVLDQRPRLGAVPLEPLAHGLLLVVVALHQRLAGRVAAALPPP